MALINIALLYSGLAEIGGGAFVKFSSENAFPFAAGNIEMLETVGIIGIMGVSLGMRSQLILKYFFNI